VILAKVAALDQLDREPTTGPFWIAFADAEVSGG